MFIELVDTLRCLEPHEESWLVASSDRMVARHIVEGTLGCPVCRASYPIHDGVVDFRRGEGMPAPPASPASEEAATRLAALLGLSDAQGFAVLMGAWGTHALAMRSLVECPLVLVDPPADVEAAPGLSLLRTDGALPLAPGASRGIAIDSTDLSGVSAVRVASAVRATRARGRLVGHASLPLPAEVHELARDESVWVAEREALASPLVALHVRRS